MTTLGDFLVFFQGQNFDEVMVMGDRVDDEFSCNFKLFMVHHLTQPVAKL